METIYAGEDVPIDRVVHQLLSDVGLRTLIGHHGVACFVLARAGLAPQFYEQLINNVYTIDATTRHHVAFIVFYGNLSILRPETGCKGYPDYYKHHVVGLSVSEGAPLRLNKWYGERDEVRFNQDLANLIRSAPSLVPFERVACVTEQAATVLMDRFNVRETALPCLLFVDKLRTNEGLVVRLSADEPMKSLYHDVLAPLSDEFRSLEVYWRERCQIEAYTDALQTLAAFPDTLHALEQSLDEVKSKKLTSGNPLAPEIAHLTNERDTLLTLCRSFDAAGSLEKRIALLPPTSQQYFQVIDVKNVLATLEPERKNTYSATPTDDERQRLAKLTDKINGLWGKLDFLARQHQYKAKKRLKFVEAALAGPQRRFNKFRQAERSIAEKIDKLNRSRLAAHETIKRLANFDFDSEQGRVVKMYETLRGIGYGDEVLRVDRPSAIDVVKTLVARGRVGVSASGESEPNKRLTILFLAANPIDTTQLDLEEELRAIEVELRGTLHREKIALVARHAVRPDDLVRHVRALVPDIVHFSGHGTYEGIVLRDDSGGYRIVPGEALSRLLKDRGVRMVVLNACFSSEQATSLSAAVDMVIGTTKEVGDEAARRFSVAFYRTLGDGYSVREAFRDGGDSIALHSLEDVYQIIGRADERFFTLGPKKDDGG